jgi:TPR repeat protein
MRHTGRAIFVAAILALSFSVPVAAGPSEDAAAAFNRRDYTTAVALYRQLAEQGNAFAQFKYATMIEYGLAVPQNYGEAMMWLVLAGKSGSGDMQSAFYALASKMPPDDVVRAQKRAAEWKATPAR